MEVHLHSIIHQKKKLCSMLFFTETSVCVGFSMGKIHRSETERVYILGRRGIQMRMQYECEYRCVYRKVCVREKEWLAYSIIIRHPKFNSILLCVSPSCRDAGLLLMYLLILAADGIVLCCNILIRWKKCRGIAFSMRRRVLCTSTGTPKMDDSCC